MTSLEKYRGTLNDLQPSSGMRNYEISIEIDEQFHGCLNERWLRDVIVETLGIQEESAAELDLLITNEETVQHLNREYRGVDGPTDVLAFALARGAPNSGAHSFVEPPDGLAHLGEVILSYPRAVRQAEEYGHSVEQEVALLVIHGVLHLLGYDHATPAGEEEMRALEGRILSAVLRQVERGPAALER